jgi:threonine dehydrogenase-like Zn-dependent dehydrogenase
MKALRYTPSLPRFFGARLRGLGKSRPWPEEVLILGMGTIGLMAVRLLRALGYSGKVHAVAKYPHQAERARAFGAERVYGSAREALQERARRYRYLLFEGYRGGYPWVVEASGSGKGFREALALAEEGGKVLLLGAPGLEWADLSPFWFKEVALVGSYTYTREEFGEAVALLKELQGPRGPGGRGLPPRGLAQGPRRPGQGPLPARECVLRREGWAPLG